jgi:hypothetical protein
MRVGTEVEQVQLLRAALHGDRVGDRPLDEITASELEALQRTITATALSRRTHRNGRNAGEHLVAATWLAFRVAASRAHKVTRPR